MRIPFYLGLVLFFMGSASSLASDRFALVIGNERYRSGPLENPAGDARTVAQSLENVGFEVFLRIDQNRSEIIDAIRQFEEKLREPKSIGFFYYAGHAIQVQGKNYLIPIEADIRSISEIEYEAVNFGRISAIFRLSRNQANIAVLDACRNNPFRSLFRSNESGLSTVTAPSGSLVAFATAPGQVASDDGLYARSLAKHIQLPHEGVETLFRSVAADVRRGSQTGQVPWFQSSVFREINLHSTSSPGEHEAQPGPTNAAEEQPANLNENSEFTRIQRNAVQDESEFLSGIEEDRRNAQAESIRKPSDDQSEGHSVLRPKYDYSIDSFLQYFD